MGLFRRPRPEPPTAPERSETTGDETPAEEITASGIGPAEQARIDDALARLAAAGVDVDDVDSLGAAFDAALDRGDAGALPDLAVGVGEHLSRHADLRWAIVTDSFGRDLGLEGLRRGLHVVPESLLSARWMRREKGWLPRAVAHLADTSRR
ncbi:DUF3806 domain-containing protein [Nostocoides sp. F2B08]|uniref:DUF3806 domain-containing protein n=1 Tax=Nostocoides sp. F2B08 TaxID=2653936 RepID=UPI00126345C6|nr:DUF3806 domain-containing protein [Tetrasphaera sp. F2B08]KAB7744537.1 DUF3806 domain-containing protein [Tetrasphaera sp. F2B08]